MITVLGRELRGYFRSPMGWVIAAAVLFIDGLLFNGFAVGSGKRLSSEVVRDFFYFSSDSSVSSVVPEKIFKRLVPRFTEIGRL